MPVGADSIGCREKPVVPKRRGTARALRTVPMPLTHLARHSQGQVLDGATGLFVGFPFRWSFFWHPCLAFASKQLFLKVSPLSHQLKTEKGDGSQMGHRFSAPITSSLTGRKAQDPSYPYLGPLGDTRPTAESTLA